MLTIVQSLLCLFDDLSVVEVSVVVSNLFPLNVHI